MAALAPWAMLRLYSAFSAYLFLDQYSILFCLAGMALLVGGRQVLRWAWPSILFLFFMIPLPGPVASKLRDPLQTLSTVLSVGVIQTLGIPCSRMGHVIQLENHQLEVAEACSGLRMMMLFFAVCVGAAFVMRRPLWERIVAVASAVPIAILANVVRVSVTAGCHRFVSPQWGEQVHDAAGLFMMPLGLLMLLAEMTLLDKLFIEAEEKGPLAWGGSAGSGPRPVSRRGGSLAGSLLAAGQPNGKGHSPEDGALTSEGKGGE